MDSRCAAVPLLLILLAGACGGDTGQQRVAFEVRAAGAEGGAARFTNDYGWTVELQAAAVSLGPIYFFDGEPLISLDRLLDWLSPIAVAHAHPGHYVAGEAMGQLLEQHSVDLLAGPATSLAMADGVTGPYNSARVALRPSAADDALLAGRSAVVSGRATLAGEDPVDFEGSLELDLEIEGIPCGLRVDGRPGHMQIAVDLQRWFKRVDFATMPAASVDGIQRFEEGTQAQNALIRGVDNTAAFAFAWIDE